MCKNWKTVSNNGNYDTESRNPILKKDEHHAEIIDITDGLVVDEAVVSFPNYKLDNYEIMRDDGVWGAFKEAKWGDENPKRYWQNSFWKWNK